MYAIMMQQGEYVRLETTEGGSEGKDNCFRQRCTQRFRFDFPFILRVFEFCNVLICLFFFKLSHLGYIAQPSFKPCYFSRQFQYSHIN